MIKIENIKVYNIARAVYSSRNAMNSWDKSDSDIENDILGKNDLSLAKRLYKAGSEHRKYLRQIFVSMDITAPLYWWKEFDTYKVGTVSNSCSTMHKIHAKEFELDDFSWEHLMPSHDIQIDMMPNPMPFNFQVVLKDTIDALNIARELYLVSKDKDYWWQMIQLLPSSYNQRRTITMNYENVMNIINQRTGHKLDEWNEFVKILRELPYVNDIRADI